MKNGSLIIYSNKKCMNTCLFCPGIGMDATDEYIFKKAIEDANHLIKNGYEMIDISGVDPGEVNGIAEIIYYLKKNGIKYVQLSTHGRTLKDIDFAHRLSKAGLDYLRVSLYGSKSDIHNKVTQVENSEGDSFRDTTLGIKNSVIYGITIAGNIRVTEYNKNDLNNIINLFTELSEGKIKEIIIGNIGISYKSYDYTSDWYLPFHKMKPFLLNVLNNENLPSYVKILDIPYCVVGKDSDIIENNNDMPDLGKHEIDSTMVSEQGNIPHYRIKQYFEECKDCSLRYKCDGMNKNDMEMFGVDGLKAIK